MTKKTEETLFDFSLHTIGDIAIVHRAETEMHREALMSFRIIAIDKETITVTNKYSDLIALSFDRHGRPVKSSAIPLSLNNQYTLRRLEVRPEEERKEQIELRQQYHTALQLKRDADKAHTERIKELLKPALDYAKEHKVEITFHTTYPLGCRNDSILYDHLYVRDEVRHEECSELFARINP